MVPCGKTQLVEGAKMSIRDYFKHINGLPDTRGLLFECMPPTLRASANREVAKIMEAAMRAKRGPYIK